MNDFKSLKVGDQVIEFPSSNKEFIHSKIRYVSKVGKLVLTVQDKTYRIKDGSLSSGSNGGYYKNHIIPATPENLALRNKAIEKDKMIDEIERFIHREYTKKQKLEYEKVKVFYDEIVRVKGENNV